MGGPWSVVAVNDLPWPHHPFRCRWRARFDAAVTEASPAAERQDAARAILTALTAADLAQCPYHEPQWEAAAEAAVAVVEAGDTSLEAIERNARRWHLDDCTTEALFSFFDEPIFVCGDQLGNGQHRVCAMKLARVTRCPIEV